MTRVRLLLVTSFLLVATRASAAPFWYESGLPVFPDNGQPVTLGEPGTVDGVQSPWGMWRKLSFGLQGDAFITYRAAFTQDATFTQFELSRLQLTAWAAWSTWAGVNVTMETIRSANAASYIGVAGDSILPRIKYAFAEATPLKQWLVIRAGVIPDLILNWVETAWTFRVQGPVGLERDGMFTPGDLGVSGEVALPAGYGSIAASYTNGEGINEPEQNNGKDTTVAAHIRPFGRKRRAFILHLLYRDGSVGAGSAADRRLLGGFTYEGRKFGAGATGVWAMGWNGIGNRDAGHLSVFARGELPKRFYLFGRIDALWTDTSVRSDVQLRLIGGVAYALPMLLRILVSYEGTLPFGALTSAVPSLREHDILAQIEARL
jgi:hypothetical protein